MASMFAKYVGLKVAKRVFQRGGNAQTTNMAATKPLMAPLKKLRIFLGLPIILILVSLLLSILLVLAGSKPGMLDNYPVFTLNVSRFGEDIHSDINGGIAKISFDDLHLNVVKRDFPAVNIPTLTAAPTTLVTMAPRDIGSVFESLTEKAGDEVDEANSAVRSKASQVKSKASSAANSVESGIDGSIDKAENKVKAKLKEFVDGAFKKIAEELKLKGFYAIHVTTTCEGDYIKGEKDTTIPTKPVISSCNKDSALNPMQWVGIFYWGGIILVGISLALSLVMIYNPGGKWINWTLLMLFASAVMMAIASVLSHGIALGAAKLIDFVGAGLSIDGQAGTNFIGLTWATTLLLVSTFLILLGFKWWIKRHPGVANKKGGSSGPSGINLGPISAPVQQSAGRAGGRAGRGADYEFERPSAGQFPDPGPQPPAASHTRPGHSRLGSYAAGGGAGEMPPPSYATPPKGMYDRHGYV